MTDNAILDRLTTALADRYRVARELGAGGMATVYLAHDLRHERDVAIKVLHPDLGAALGADRFLAEIKTTAKLQHPHILPLLDSGAADGLLYYVMPYVRGETLRARLERERQLPVPDALRIAREVAAALDHAHKQGIIHRDIKPENILLQDGAAVVADFGIALAVQTAGGARMTQTGLSLGTPQYMSPEQAMGEKTIEARSDIYALGAVTYEMLAGEPPFSGPSTQAIVAKVLSERPVTLLTLRDSVSPAIERAVMAALSRASADRPATAAEFARLLTMDSDPATAARTVARPRASRWVGMLAALGPIVAAGATWWVMRGSSATGDTVTPVRFELSMRGGQQVAEGLGSSIALSNDGNTVVYVALSDSTPPRLYVRELDAVEPRELLGTDGAFQPAISSDGQWVAYVVDDQVKKMPIAGGAPVTLAAVPSVRGITWVPGGDIIVGTGRNGLSVIPAEGGAAKPLTTTTDGETNGHSHRWPMVLDDGKSVVFTDFNDGGLSASRLAFVRLGETKVYGTGVAGTSPLGVVGNSLVYVNTVGAIMAVPVHVPSLELTGAPIELAERVAVDPTVTNAAAALSKNGTLAFVQGSFVSQLVSFDRRGVRTTISREPRVFQQPRISPDGRRVVLSVMHPAGADLWILDRESGTPARLTDGKTTINDRPEWSADGKRVLYRSTREHTTSMWSQPLDVGTEPVALTPGLNSNEAMETRAGDRLLVRLSDRTGKYRNDLVWRYTSKDTALRDLLVTPWAETGSRPSPDGNWVAYSSDESGARQVYVTAFPGPGPRYQISVEGGEQPVWSPRDRSLFYVRGRRIIEAKLDIASDVRVLARETVLETNFVSNYTHAGYDVAPDGARFVALVPVEGARRPMIAVGWKTELLRRLGGAR